MVSGLDPIALEEWRPAAGYLGYYEVSSYGNVRSLDRKIVTKRGVTKCLTGKPMKLTTNSDGYLVVNLWMQGLSRVWQVHKLVATAFLGAPLTPDLQVLHRDGQNGNAALRNLRYGTQGENELDKVRHGTHQNSRKTRCPLEHKLAQPNLIPSSLVRGLRACLSCNRGRTYLKKHPGLDLRSVADRYYADLMGANR